MYISNCYVICTGRSTLQKFLVTRYLPKMFCYLFIVIRYGINVLLAFPLEHVARKEYKTTFTHKTIGRLIPRRMKIQLTDVFVIWIFISGILFWKCSGLVFELYWKKCISKKIIVNLAKMVEYFLSFVLILSFSPIVVIGGNTNFNKYLY